MSQNNSRVSLSLWMMGVRSGSLGHTLPALQPPTPAAILGNWPRDVTSWINSPRRSDTTCRGRCPAQEVQEVERGGLMLVHRWIVLKGAVEEVL